MIIVVTSGEVSLSEADVFTDFHAEFAGVSDESAAALVAESGCGLLDGEHLWVNQEWLRSHGRSEESWLSDFQAMIDYAAKKGWVSDDGQVRAHVVRQPAAG